MLGLETRLMFPSMAASCISKNKELPGNCMEPPLPFFIRSLNCIILLLTQIYSCQMPNCTSFLWSYWNPQLYKQGHRNTKKCHFYFLATLEHNPALRLYWASAPSHPAEAPQPPVCSSPRLCWRWLGLCDTKAACGLAASLAKCIKIIFEGRWE